MKLISRTPSSKRGYSIFLIVLVFVIVLSIVWLMKKEVTQSSVDLSESIKLAAISILEKDPNITDFTIDNIKQSHRNNESEEVYTLTFSIKPIDPANFILTGGGVKGENGWIHERVNYVTVKDSETLVFSSNPSEDH